MQTNLTLNLEIGFFNNQSMTLRILSNGHEVVPLRKFTSATESITFAVDLPTNIDILLSDRLDSDTELDHDYNIVQDKNIHLKSIVLFDTLFESYKFPPEILKYTDYNNTTIDPNFFWNKNGKVSINLDDEDPLGWILKHHDIW